MGEMISKLILESESMMERDYLGNLGIDER
jgi:hypothetical protein